MFSQEGFMDSNKLPVGFAMMRHDINRKLKNALFTARREAESGIRAMYYFRRYGSAFRSGIMREKGGGTRQISLRGVEDGERGSSVY
jgi:hypothetical protein